MKLLLIFLLVWLAPAIVLLLGAVTFVTWERIRRGRADNPPRHARENPSVEQSPRSQSEGDVANQPSVIGRASGDAALPSRPAQ